MLKRIFLTLNTLNTRTRLVLAGAGFALVHVAAALLYTASAPYLGALSGLVGLALFMVGSRSPGREKKSVSAKSFYLRA